MKKLLKPSIILLLMIVIAISGKAYAASLDCNLEIQTAKTEYSKGEEFTASVYVSGIKSEKGVLALSATLDYDKDSLTLVGMEGKNSWETPTKDVSYNESNGKIAIVRSGLGKDDEVIFEIKFKVKEDSDASASISLKEATIANGYDTQKSFSTLKKDLTIKAASSGTDNPGTNNPGTDNPSTDNPSTDKPSTDKPSTNKPDTNKPGTTPTPVTPSTNTNKNNTNTNTNTNTNKTVKNTTNTNTNVTDMTAKTNGAIPKTGITDHPVLMISLIGVTISGLYFYTKINFIDKKAKKL